MVYRMGYTEVVEHVRYCKYSTEDSSVITHEKVHLVGNTTEWISKVPDDRAPFCSKFPLEVSNNEGKRNWSTVTINFK